MCNNNKQQRNMWYANAAREEMVTREMSRDRVPNRSHQTGIDDDDYIDPVPKDIYVPDLEYYYGV